MSTTSSTSEPGGHGKGERKSPAPSSPIFEIRQESMEDLLNVGLSRLEDFESRSKTSHTAQLSPNSGHTISIASVVTETKNTDTKTEKKEFTFEKNAYEHFEKESSMKNEFEFTQPPQ
jgi:hypothetical protein